MPTSVSILIVTWNSEAAIAATLDALPPGCQVVVFDNASIDGTVAILRGRGPSIRLECSPRNLGFAGGVNAAARLASSPYLLLLNPDARPVGDGVGQLARFLDDHPDASAAAGRLVGVDGKTQRSFTVRRLPTLGAVAADLLLVARVWPGNPATRRYLAADLDERRAAEVEQPAGACLMVRREWFDRLGGFDERFAPAWFEDVDFCRRLRDAGGHAWFVPDAVFAHEGGSSVSAMGRPAFLRAYYANLRRYISRHHSALASAVVGLLVPVGLCLRAAAAGLAGRPAEARAFLAALRSAGDARRPD